jgi:hypothetical protein
MIDGTEDARQTARAQRDALRTAGDPNSLRDAATATEWIIGAELARGYTEQAEQEIGVLVELTCAKAPSRRAALLMLWHGDLLLQRGDAAAAARQLSMALDALGKVPELRADHAIAATRLIAARLAIGQAGPQEAELGESSVRFWISAAAEPRFEAEARWWWAAALDQSGKGTQAGEIRREAAVVLADEPFAPLRALAGR